MLFIDNCKAIPEMKSVKVEFLLPNMMSKLQPMNQRIIQSFKTKFQNQLLKKSYKIKRKEPNVDVIEAMRMAHKAWNDETTPVMISNCF